MEKSDSVWSVFIDEESIRLYKLLFIVAVPIAILIVLLGDANIVIYVNTNRPRALDPFFAFYTNWGNYIMMFAMIAFLVAAFTLDRLKEYRPMLFALLISAVITDLIIVQIIKVTVNRTRPWAAYNLEIVGAKPPVGESFPSGHTSEAFTYATPLMLKFKNTALRIALLTYAILMGFSRIYAGVHYPSDVLAGAVLAILLTYWFYRIAYYYEDTIKESNLVRIITFIILALALTAVALT